MVMKFFVPGSEPISYVKMLDDWEILPKHLQVLKETLGSGQFGIVKKGFYTPFEEEDPNLVAVKMLKGR